MKNKIILHCLSAQDHRSSSNDTWLVDHIATSFQLPASCPARPPAAPLLNLLHDLRFQQCSLLDLTTSFIDISSLTHIRTLSLSLSLSPSLSPTNSYPLPLGLSILANISYPFFSFYEVSSDTLVNHLHIQPLVLESYKETHSSYHYLTNQASTPAFIIAQHDIYRVGSSSSRHEIGSSLHLRDPIRRAGMPTVGE